MSKKFKRTVENFICENCGTPVTGTGYTNHCPKCLWSKHVDKSPGDRTELCRGLMEPVAVETKGQTQYIVHKCIKCGVRKRNKRQPEDDFDVILSIARNW